MDDKLTDSLRSLRQPAPGGVLPAVLIKTGIADGYVTRSSPLGLLYVAFSEHGISFVDIAGTAESFEQRFRDHFGRRACAAGSMPTELASSLARAIDTGRTGSLPLDLRGLSAFHVSVLHKAAEIPSGETRPYTWVAHEVGNPKAARAVGRALAANPVPLLVPCHRVVRADGRLGRYSLGEDANKRRLLEAEGLDTNTQAQLAGRGVRLLGSDTTHIYCYPTCSYARRITDVHRVEFKNARQAETSGYRPCKNCRPKGGRSPELSVQDSESRVSGRYRAF